MSTGEVGRLSTSGTFLTIRLAIIRNFRHVRQITG